jgi:hypothetical protein
MLAAAGIVALPLASRVSLGLDGTRGDVEPAEPIFTGREVFERLMRQAEAENWRRLPIGERMGAVGMALRGTPYVGSTLELYEDREVCSVNLLGLDCVTFFEIALGFSRMLVKGGSRPQDLLDQITMTRYRDGRIDDYASRLHYTADWFHDNHAKGVVRVITQALPGAERFTQKIDFMSTHPDAYRQLKANPTLVRKIGEIESRINKRTMHYVPKERVAAIESRLQTGDIIGITTTIKGIDCSHTGMCYRDENEALRFLHASLTEKKVILDVTLSEYLASVKKHTGIMVARPVEV